jgi:ribosome-binding factor A
MTERTVRLDELLLQEISRIIAREIHDPRIGFVTVTKVDVTPDLRHARVWVSMIGQADERATAFRALGRAMPFVRHELGELRLKRVPELHLLLDDSVERGTRVMQILDDLEAGREPREIVPGETLPTPGPGAADPSEPAEGKAP